jgi:hypothetical protein
MVDLQHRPIWEVHDRYGHRLYMTAERWQHVLKQRPWLAEHLDDVLETLRHGRRKQDPMDSTKYKYSRQWEALFPEYNHLVAVVRFGEAVDPQGRSVPNNYVVTAWAVFRYSRS